MRGPFCHCGHSEYDHRSACVAMIEPPKDLPFEEWLRTPPARCGCQVFDDSELPGDGERLTFGQHRQRTPDAETAPAWPSPGSVESARESAFQRTVKRAHESAG